MSLQQKFREYFDQETETPSLQKFCCYDTKFFVEQSNPSGIRGTWIQRFKKALEDCKINSYEEEEPDWDVVKQYIENNQAVAPKEKNSTRSPSTPQSSPSSSSSAVTKLSASQKNECKELYNNIDDDKKWVLSTQTVVEDQMYKHAMKCDYHHPSHSIIMDPQDNCWTEYFSTEELQEIKNHKKVVLDPIPDDLREYLYSYSGKHDVEGLFQHNIKKLYHPITQPDLHWAQKIIMEALDLYFYKYLPIDDHTEADLIHRVWHFIEKCYDESKIVVRSGEKVSNASSNRINGDRFVKGTEKMKKMEIGHKVDLLFTHEKQEFGCGEAGLKGDKNGMKAMIESNLKLPRLLKDMLCELVYESPSKIRDTKVAGFIISGLNLTLIVMDSPAGCLTRVSKIGPLAYPTTPEVFAKKMIPLLMLTWQVKSLMKESVRLICFDDTVEEPSFDASPSCPIPPCISSPKGRKRKLGDLDD